MSFILIKIFKVNQYITLKLEHDKTIIYINDLPFNQCKYLLLNIPTTDNSKMETINSFDSIDEIAEVLDKSMERNLAFNITPEEEFQAHCSNIQAWAENNYDSRILHRNLAFPFLRKLADAGDLRAKHMFQEEIIKRFNHGYFRIMVFLLNNNYFSYLDVEQFEHLDLSSLFSITPNQQSEILLSINNINVKNTLKNMIYRKFRDKILTEIALNENRDLFQNFKDYFVDRDILKIYDLNYTFALNVIYSYNIIIGPFIMKFLIKIFRKNINKIQNSFSNNDFYNILDIFFYVLAEHLSDNDIINVYKLNVPKSLDLILNPYIFLRLETKTFNFLLEDFANKIDLPFAEIFYDENVFITKDTFCFHWFTIGQFYESFNYKDRAIKIFELCYQINPNNEEFFLRLLLTYKYSKKLFLYNNLRKNDIDLFKSKYSNIIKEIEVLNHLEHAGIIIDIFNIKSSKSCKLCEDFIDTIDYQILLNFSSHVKSIPCVINNYFIDWEGYSNFLIYNNELKIIGRTPLEFMDINTQNYFKTVSLIDKWPSISIDIIYKTGKVKKMLFTQLKKENFLPTIITFLRKHNISLRGLPPKHYF